MDLISHSRLVLALLALLAPCAHADVLETRRLRAPTDHGNFDANVQAAWSANSTRSTVPPGYRQRQSRYGAQRRAAGRVLSRPGGRDPRRERHRLGGRRRRDHLRVRAGVWVRLSRHGRCRLRRPKPARPGPCATPAGPTLTATACDRGGRYQLTVEVKDSKGESLPGKKVKLGGGPKRKLGTWFDPVGDELYGPAIDDGRVSPR